MTDIQTCPRRILEMGPWDRSEGIDSWMESPRRAGEVTPFCSFCGSLHPGKFLELIAQGWQVEPTDKNYKAYLSSPPPAPQSSGPVRTIGESRSKFYYLHLSPTQQVQFIDLYNQRQMQISTPGYFYVLPFFMTIAPRAS